MSSAEIVTIISAVSVALVSVISAWRTNSKVETLKQSTEASDARAEKTVEILKESTERTAGVADKKLDKIHDLTNSSLDKVKTDLTIANDRIEKLESLLMEVIEKPGNKENKAKVAEEMIRKTPKKE